MRLGPPGAGWAWDFKVNPRMVEDALWFESHCRYQYEKATELAAEQEFELDGHWELEQHPMVWIEGPEPEGGLYMAEQHARSLGVTTPVTLIECVARCGARKILER